MIIVGNETCDDGNTKDGDGCSKECLIEIGYACSGVGRDSCHTVCGDGILAGFE